jgi:hypothetical protein
MARIPARIASGRVGQAATTSARSRGAWLLSVGKWWAGEVGASRKGLEPTTLSHSVIGLRNRRLEVRILSGVLPPAPTDPAKTRLIPRLTSSREPNRLASHLATNRRIPPRSVS